MDHWDLISKYVQNELSAAEQEQLDQWLRNDPDHAQILTEAKATWQASGSVQYDLKVDKSAARQKVKQRIQKHQRNKRLRLASGLAASLLIGTLAIFFWPGASDQVTVLAEDSGQQLNLPDGSTVWLREGSTLSYPATFDGDIRYVSLTGEGFFEIKRQPEQPFIVKGGQTEIKVLGTSFHVNTQSGDTAVVLNVVEGQVAFRKQQNQGVEFLAGESGYVLNSATAPIHLSQQNLSFRIWQQERFVFDNTPLSTVLQTLEDHFKVHFVVENPTLKDCLFTGRFAPDQLKPILEALRKTVGLQIDLKDTTYQISGPGC